MARTPQDVTEKELAILQVLWEQGPATIRQITDVVYPQGGTSKYATVQKLLERLEMDGYVGRDRHGAAHTFSATVDREGLIGRRLQAVAEQLCGGSLTPLLTDLVRTKKLNARERRELRSLIEELNEVKPSRSDRR